MSTKANQRQSQAGHDFALLGKIWHLINFSCICFAPNHNKVILDCFSLKARLDCTFYEPDCSHRERALRRGKTSEAPYEISIVQCLINVFSLKIKLHILEGSAIVISPRDNCANIMQFNQHLSMPHLLGGWIVLAVEKCSLKQNSTNRNNLLCAQTKSLIFDFKEKWEQKQKYSVYIFVECSFVCCCFFHIGLTLIFLCSCC